MLRLLWKQVKKSKSKKKSKIIKNVQKKRNVQCIVLNSCNPLYNQLSTNKNLLYLAIHSFKKLCSLVYYFYKVRKFVNVFFVTIFFILQIESWHQQSPSEFNIKYFATYKNVLQKYLDRIPKKDKKWVNLFVTSAQGIYISFKDKFYHRK